MVRHALVSQQDDLASSNNLLRRGARPEKGFQLASLPFVDSKSRGRNKHANIES